MIELTKSRVAMLIVWLAAALVTAGLALEGLAFTLISSNMTTADNLNTAASWMYFAGWTVGVVALVAMTWTLSMGRRWAAAGETGAMSVATIVIAAGAFDGAVNSNGSQTTAEVLAAVGIGGWFLFCAVKAVRRSLVEHDDPAQERFAAMWLGAAGALALIAVGQGLPPLDVGDAAMGVTQAVFGFAGFVLLLAVVVVARANSVVKTPQFPFVAAGLGLAALASLGQAVASGVVLGSPPYTVLGVRLGTSIPEFVLALGIASLTLAAVSRVYEIPARPQTAGGGTAAASPTVPEA